MGHYFFYFLSTFVLLSLSLLEAKPSKFLSLSHASYEPGMFCVVNTVLGLLETYDRGQCAGAEVDFEDRGVFYDPSHGLNWWTYYFTPVVVGDKGGATVLDLSYKRQREYAYIAYAFLTRERGHQLFHRYIRLLPHIEEKIDRFAADNFEGYSVIGVHYRGTDKATECPLISYEEMFEAIRTAGFELRTDDYKIFVATDERSFLNRMIDVFSDKVVYYEAKRSEDGKPLHKSEGDKYEKGEEAIIDCFLLSKTAKLVRTNSNLSFFVRFLNPTLPIIYVTPFGAKIDDRK